MTIAISLKVNDGVVLASDSATTLRSSDEHGNANVLNVYNNADKVFNLCKGIPVGAITWGFGAIGNSSIATLMKDFRGTLENDTSSYEVRQLAERLKEYIYTNRYRNTFNEWPEKPILGFIVAGYSNNGQSSSAEEYLIEIDASGNCHGPNLVRQADECGVSWHGQPEAIFRLMKGRSTLLPALLQQKFDVPDEQIKLLEEAFNEHLSAPLINPAMPIKDAVDLAEFLVDVTIKFSRFMPGATMVDGPIDIAAITKHEGFKWIRRKYYYPRSLNPGREK